MYFFRCTFVFIEEIVFCKFQQWGREIEYQLIFHPQSEYHRFIFKFVILTETLYTHLKHFYNGMKKFLQTSMYYGNQAVIRHIFLQFQYMCMSNGSFSHVKQMIILPFCQPNCNRIKTFICQHFKLGNKCSSNCRILNFAEMLLPNIGWAVFSHRLCIDVIRKCGSNICWFFFYSFECNMKLLTWMHNKPKNNYRKLMVIFINSFNFFFIYFFRGADFN